MEKAKTRKTQEEKLADQIATGKQKFVHVDRELLPKVGEIFEKKYKGSFTWFGLGNAVCMRDKKEPCKLRTS